MKLLLSFVLVASVSCTQKNSVAENDVAVGVRGGDYVSNQEVLKATVMVGEHCTGSYIGNNKILTAGHCVLSTMTDVSFFNPETDESTTCKVLSASVHPLYRTKKLSYADIAVLTVDCPSDALAEVMPFELAEVPAFAEEVFAGGYGRSEQVDGMNFPLLKEIFVYPMDLETYVEENQPNDVLSFADEVEAIKQGAFSCFKADYNNSPLNGDSGGPTYFYEDDYYVVAAVNDVLFHPRGTGLKQIYAFCATNVAFYRDWILAQ